MTASIQSDSDFSKLDLNTFVLNDEQKVGKLEHVPMLIKRRLKEGDSLAINCAIQCLKHFNLAEHCLEAEFIDAIIFSSCHGTLERSTSIIEQLCTNSEVSPTDFTFSVHNSAVGQLSIMTKQSILTTAISHHDDSFFSALIKAFALLQQGYNKVLLVDYESRIPQAYQQIVQDNVSLVTAPYATAFVLGRGHNFSCFQKQNHIDNPQIFFNNLLSYRNTNKQKTCPKSLQCYIHLVKSHNSFKLNSMNGSIDFSYTE